MWDNINSERKTFNEFKGNVKMINKINSQQHKKLQRKIYFREKLFYRKQYKKEQIIFEIQQPQPM